jgi:hypothetical protein
MDSFELRTQEVNPFRFHRGAATGAISASIRAEARELGLPIAGDGRLIRLKMASKLLGKQVPSFNNLDDREIWSIHRWCRLHSGELRQWLKDTYGYQEELPLGEVAE